MGHRSVLLARSACLCAVPFSILLSATCCSLPRIAQRAATSSQAVQKDGSFQRTNLTGRRCDVSECCRGKKFAASWHRVRPCALELQSRAGVWAARRLPDGAGAVISSGAELTHCASPADGNGCRHTVASWRYSRRFWEGQLATGCPHSFTSAGGAPLVHFPTTSGGDTSGIP